MAGRVPVIGPWVVQLVLGGETIGGDSLSRFFALHVFVIPGALLAFLGLHLWQVLRLGVSKPPKPSEPVDPKTYDVEYHEELKRGVPFFGDALLKDIVISSLAVIVVVAIAAIVGPKGPTDPPDPTHGRRQSAARMAVSLVVCPAFAQPTRCRDVYHSRVSADC